MDYMIRIGISSQLNDEQVEQAIEGALNAAGLLNSVYEVEEDNDDGQWTLAHKGKHDLAA